MEYKKMKYFFLLLNIIFICNICQAHIGKSDSILIKGYMVVEYSKQQVKKDYKNFERQISGKSFYMPIDDMKRYKLYLYDSTKTMELILKTSVPDTLVYFPGFYDEPLINNLLNKNRDFDTFSDKFICLSPPLLYVRGISNKLFKIYYFEALCTTVTIDTYSDENLDLLAKNSIGKKIQKNKNYTFFFPKRVVTRNYFDKVISDKSIRLYNWLPY